MIETFTLAQLYKSDAPEFIKGTCCIHNWDNGDRFECSIKLTKPEKEQLWKYVSGNWKGLTAEIEFEEVNSIGLPKDGVIISIKGFTPINF